MKITQCECGSKEFVLDENITHSMILTEDGNLESKRINDDTIDQIFCAQCYKGYNADNFNEIIF